MTGDPTRISRTLAWGRFVVGLLSVALGAMILSGVATIAYLEATGWDVSVVVSDSMAPRLRAGDVIASPPDPGPVDRLGPGTIIRFDNGAGPYVHRIVGVNGDGSYATKGDAVGRRDTDPVRVDQVIGTPRIMVPWIGHPVLPSGRGHLSAALGVLIGFALVQMAPWGFATRFEPWRTVPQVR